MVFGMIMLVLVVAVAFYHYIQGFFSAMVSAVLAIIAAMLAISLHEPIAERLLAGHLPAQAHAIALVGVFALAYVVQRLVTDKLVPGNIRMHVLTDKIGAAAFGAVAGVFAAGTVAVAAQTLPFGPSIGGYSRFPLADRETGAVKVPGKYQQQILTIYGEMEADTLDASRASALFPLSVDSMVLGLASYVSNGSLAGDRPLASVHPDYATELFAQRLAQPFGGRLMYSDIGGSKLAVGGVYTSKWVLNQPADGELKVIRGERTPAVPGPDSGVPVVLRLAMTNPTGRIQPLTPSSARLCIDGRNYYPVGTYQRGEQLQLARPDDPLFEDAGKPIEFVFMVEGDQLVHRDGNALQLPPGAFVEVRGSARADLSGKDIASDAPAGATDVGVLQKAKQ